MRAQGKFLWIRVLHLKHLKRKIQNPRTPLLLAGWFQYRFSKKKKVVFEEYGLQQAGAGGAGQYAAVLLVLYRYAIHSLVWVCRMGKEGRTTLAWRGLNACGPRGQDRTRADAGRPRWGASRDENLLVLILFSTLVKNSPNRWPVGFGAQCAAVAAAAWMHDSPSVRRFIRAGRLRLLMPWSVQTSPISERNSRARQFKQTLPWLSAISVSPHSILLVPRWIFGHCWISRSFQIL